MYTKHRAFDWETQRAFARISCDCNPIHVDPIAARRTHAGSPIVHGIHSLLWLLDCIAETPFQLGEARGLRVQFSRPIYVGDSVRAEISEKGPSTVYARIANGSDELVCVSLSPGGTTALHPHKARQTPSLRTMPPPDQAIEWSLQDIEGMSGRLAFSPLTSDLADLFPSAARAFGRQKIAALACSSCLVGMVVPGLHSVFSGLDVTFAEDGTTPENTMSYAVESIVTRFRAVRIGVQTRCMHGFLDTVSRLPPVRQLTTAAARGLVGGEEFRNSTALVVGGSRGLGELTGKLLAAGGAKVVITYVTGKTDADAVVDDVRRNGLECTAVRYDALKPALEQLAASNVAPTHIYYFPTPVISRRKSGFLDSERLAEFNSFYVSGFLDLVQACIQLRPSGIRVFYPSTIFVVSRPSSMTEYAMSKAAAEVLCTDIERSYPRIKVMTRRLPRLPTDQTNSIVQIEMDRPVDVLLPIVREMQGVSILKQTERN